MQGDVNDAVEYGKDAIVSFETLFELDVLVPERMSQKIQTNAFCSAIEKTIFRRLVMLDRSKYKVGCKQGWWARTCSVLSSRLSCYDKTRSHRIKSLEQRQSRS